jgi:hypothetical protein
MPGPLDALKSLQNRLTQTPSGLPAGAMGHPYGEGAGEMRGEMPLGPGQMMPQWDEVQTLLRALRQGLSRVPNAATALPGGASSAGPAVQGLQRAVTPLMDEAYQRYIGKLVR